MVDVHNKEQRRKNMRAIKSADTSIEVRVRKMLWHAGYRYRLNVKSLPGAPDIYLSKYRAAIQINGCLWHGHNCPQFVLPKTRPEFWKSKITDNVLRDFRNLTKVNDYDIRQLVIWQCSLQGTARLPEGYILSLIERWLRGKSPFSLIDKNGLSQLSTLNYFNQISSLLPSGRLID